MRRCPIFVLLLLLSWNALAAEELGRAEFRAILARFQAAFAAAAAAHGARLLVGGEWDDPTVNAIARQYGSDWIIDASGGLARHPALTRLGFLAALCHELGHHLGGFPFSPSTPWSATEGAADYFVTQVCLPHLFEREPAWLTDVAESPLCADQVCAASVLAARSLTALLAARHAVPPPNPLEPDLTVVEKTLAGHPSLQCRLDTLVAGAQCARKRDPAHIPGKGLAQPLAEEDMARQSCHPFLGELQGTRPRCWYRAELEYPGLRLGELRVQEIRGNGNGIPEPGEEASVVFPLQNTSGRVERNLIGNVEGTRVAWPDVTPGSTVESEMPVRIPSDRPCGSRFEFDLFVNSAQASVRLRTGFSLGEASRVVLAPAVSGAPIPDASPGGLTVVQEVHDDFTVTAVEVAVRVHHGFPGDLTFSLRSPDGRAVRLGAHPVVPGPVFAESFRANLFLHDARGPWYLRIFDDGRGDAGTLESWQLTFHAAQCR